MQDKKLANVISDNKVFETRIFQRTTAFNSNVASQMFQFCKTKMQTLMVSCRVYHVWSLFLRVFLNVK